SQTSGRGRGEVLLAGLPRRLRGPLQRLPPRSERAHSDRPRAAALELADDPAQLARAGGTGSAPPPDARLAPHEPRARLPAGRADGPPPRLRRGWRAALGRRASPASVRRGRARARPRRPRRPRRRGTRARGIPVSGDARRAAETP